MVNEPGLYHLQDQLSKWKPNKINPNLKRKLSPGWMIPYLLDIDMMTWQRWDYWAKIMMAGKLLPEPIPQIEFDFGSCRNAEGEGSGARNHIEKCLDLIPQHGSWLGWSSWQYFDYFMDWLLFGFGYHGQPEEPTEPSGCTGASMRLYQYFNLAWLICYPYDYFGGILAANNHGRALGFFPTPMPVVNMICQMLMPGEDNRTKTVCDPCLGTGRMLLYASNYSLRLYGQDINPTVIKASLVNGYLYAPWMVKPFPFLDAALCNGHVKYSDGETVSQKVSDDMSNGEAVTSRPDVTEYLDNTEHDTEHQWKFEPIKKRRKKDAYDTKSEPEYYQGCLF
jgi:hypothetical protein